MMKKTKSKKGASAAKEVSGNLIACWWKLSVKERRQHFHTIKIELLSPFLFSRTFKDAFCLHWATDVGITSKKQQKRMKEVLLDEDFKTIDLVEEAVKVLQENLSKFDGNRYLDNMINSMERTRKDQNGKIKLVLPTARNTLVELNQQDWFKHFRSSMVQSRKLDSSHRDTALLIAAMQVFVYIRSLHDGEKPLELFKTLADLSDDRTRAEKERGNKFFIDKQYEKAINIYSNILHSKPYSHIIYCNRAQCYLTMGSYRLALADARRTIALDPSSEKGQYRYCRSLEFMGKFEDAARAVRNALEACPSSADLEKLQKRIGGLLGPNGLNEKLKMILRSDEPPELTSASSGDQSSEEEDHDDYDEDESECCCYDSYEDFSDLEDDSASLKATDMFSDSDEWYDIDDPVNSQSTVENRRKEQNKVKKKTTQVAAKYTKKGKNKIMRPANEQSLLDLQREMRKGTKSFMAGNYDIASTYFNLVLNLIKCAKNFSLPREEEVVLIYAYGMCSFECGSAEDMDAAKTQFDLIIENFKDINFPLAYYGCGRILHKKLKFLEMHSVLQKCLQMIAQSGVVMRKWPGSDIIIDETRPGRLKQYITKLLDTVVGAPRPPDATCRFDACELDRNIFMDDIDFKGFIQIKCNESCKIEYHSACWQKVKKKLNFKDQSPLKEFLNRMCLTPDCNGKFYFIHYVFLNREGQVKSKEHKIELPKKLNKGGPKVDKTKRMQACSYKKLQKRSSLELERERKQAEIIKEIDDDITSILNELDEEEAMCQQISEVSKGEPYLGPEPELPIWMEIPNPVNDFSSQKDAALFPLNKEDEVIVQSPKPTNKKSKKKSKRNKAKASQRLTNFLGDEDTDNLRDVLQETRGLNRSSSLSSSVTSSSVDVTVTGFEQAQNTGMPSDLNQDGTRETVIEHLRSIFGDLLVSKGRMNVETDDDAKDLLNILDSYSSRVINSWGGLRSFLASSSKFAFDPDEPNVVYLAEEAEIYLFSKREAARRNGIGFYDENESLPYDDIFHDKKNVRAQGRKPEFASDPAIVSFSKESSSSAKNVKTSSTTPSLDENEGWKIIGKGRKVYHNVRNSADAVWFNSGMNAGTVHTNGKHGAHKLHSTSSLEQFPDLYEHGTRRKPSSEQGYNSAGNRGSGKRLDADQLRYEIIKQSKSSFANHDTEKVKPNRVATADAAVMTDNEINHETQLQEKEAAEKKDLYESYVKVMDSCEQLKNRLKIDKEAASVREVEMKGAIEELKSKLMREQQSKESAQKKWQQQKEKLNGTIKTLYEKIAAFDENSYKVKLKEQEEDNNRMTIKIGEMKLKQEQVESENQDIISKLSNCVTEQSKRAQKAEISFMELKKIEICSDFKRNLDNIQGTIYLIENNPFLDPTINRPEMLKAWKAHYETVSNNMRKCMAMFDGRIQILKNGTPLDQAQPITVPQHPAPPPQPKMMPCPPDMANPAMPMPMPVPPNVPGMPTANMPAPLMMMLQNGMRPQVPISTSGAQAVSPTSMTKDASLTMDLKAEPKSPRSNHASFANIAGAISHDASTKATVSPPAEEVTGARSALPSVPQGEKVPVKPNEKGAGKSSSFEKIMAKLCSQFPSFSRDELIKFLKEFREKRNNTLAGLRVEEIIACVSKMIKQSNMLDKKLMSIMPDSAMVHDHKVKSKIKGKAYGFEEPCIICHEDMLSVKGTTRLQCHHVFHAECINRWLKEQRTCPTCRNHALLPDEFPSLN